MKALRWEIGQTRSWLNRYFLPYKIAIKLKRCLYHVLIHCYRSTIPMLMMWFFILK